MKLFLNFIMLLVLVGCSGDDDFQKLSVSDPSSYKNNAKIIKYMESEGFVSLVDRQRVMRQHSFGYLVGQNNSQRIQEYTNSKIYPHDKAFPVGPGFYMGRATKEQFVSVFKCLAIVSHVMLEGEQEKVYQEFKSKYGNVGLLEKSGSPTYLVNYEGRCVEFSFLVVQNFEANASLVVLAMTDNNVAETNGVEKEREMRNKEEVYKIKRLF